MKNEQIDINEIVKITQLPEIYSQLDVIGKYIDENLQGINEMECTDDNVKEVKKRRTEIRNTLKVLEDKRKSIKKAISEPYEQFNSVYEDKIKTKLQSADEILAKKVAEIENEQKAQKEAVLRVFFKEYQLHYNLENIAQFEDMGLNITLSATEKSLKEQIKTYLEKIEADINLIKLEEFSEEIMFEYKRNGFSYAQAKIDVINRHKELEELSRQKEVEQEQQEKQQKMVEKIEEIVVPTEIKEEPTETEQYLVKFEIKATKEQIHKLKEFMKQEGIIVYNG